mgnify:CR=1 FL=1
MKLESVVLAGGCFWGMEELFRQIPGVISTDVGYAGGTTENPKYSTVKLGNTGHAESLKIDFDADTLSFENLLYFFFKVHDPTTTDRQGNDVGSQYRSAIFYSTDDQKQTAEKVIAKVNSSGVWKKPVVTQVEKAGPFYRAEDDHQDYLQKYPDGYTCHYIRPIEYPR